MPNDPERLNVINRCVTVLGAITAGATYFFSPYKVIKFHVVREQENVPLNKPLYMVLSDMGEITFAGTQIYDEMMTVSVLGMIEHSTDLVGAIEKAREDVINALAADANSVAAGTLGALTDGMDVAGSPVVHYEPGKNWGIFRQDFKVRIQIDF
jgi:hypothetical protein